MRMSRPVMAALKGGTMPEPTNNARRWGAGRVAFLSQKDMFRSLIKAGHPFTSIYADHGAALGISYTQFTRYVRKYLPDAITDREHQKGPAPAPVPAAAPAAQPPAQGVENRSPAINTPDKKKAGVPFQHDAEASKRTDLI